MLVVLLVTCGLLTILLDHQELFCGNMLGVKLKMGYLNIKETQSILDMLSGMLWIH